MLTFAATDVDSNGESGDSNNTLTWSVESSDDGGKFSIDSSSGALTFSTAPDFETPTDVGDTAMNNTYVATVKVTDNGIEGSRAASNHKSDTHEITVTVTNVNEAPTITTTDTAPSKMEIEYDDDSPDLSVVTYMASDPDTQAGNTLTWSLEGTDAGDFDIDSGTGALTFKAAPNYEIPVDDDTNNSYSITVKVTDNGIPTERGMTTWLDATLAVVVTVTDVNERPDIDENFDPPQNYMEVDFYFDGTVSAVHTFTATDYDDMGADPFTWSLGGGDTGDFSIGNTTGVLTFNQDASLGVGPLPSFEDPQDADTDNDYEITVIATDDEMYAGEYAVTVTVTDAEEAGRVAVVHERSGQEIADSDLSDLQVDDVLKFTLSDPDTIPAPLTDAAIDWAIERRNAGEMTWVALTGQDRGLVDQGVHHRRGRHRQGDTSHGYLHRPPGRWQDGGERRDRRRDGRAWRLAPPRFRSGDTQTIPEGRQAATPRWRSWPPTGTARCLSGALEDGPDSDLFEILPLRLVPSDRMIDHLQRRPGQRVRRVHRPAEGHRGAGLREPYSEDSNPTPPIELTVTLSDGREFENGRIVYNDVVRRHLPGDH